MQPTSIEGFGSPKYILYTLLLLISVTLFHTGNAEAELTSPATGSTVSGTTQIFTWSEQANTENWWLYVGTSQGANDIANSGNLGTATRYSVIGLPVNGATLHARLWSYSESLWSYTDSTFTAAQLGNIDAPALVSPTAGSELEGGTARIEWRDNNTPVNFWWLYIGTEQGGSDIYNSGPSLSDQSSVTVGELPENGSTVHIRLWYRTAADGWQHVDNAFSTMGPDDTTGNNSEAENLALITNNSTRNTQFDDNPYRNVPASDISVSDLTINGDAYNEPLLDTANSGYFRVKCEVSHFAYDDPIVHPGEPGRAHLHMFFGNTQTNAFSTFDSLLNTGTGTCNGEDLNRTAYWVPALLDSQGNALIPDEIMVYYKNDNFRLEGANELVEPFPDNLRMIAGNPSSQTPQTAYTGAWQALPAISFICGPAYHSDSRRQPLIPDCSGSGNQLEMQVAFPQCARDSNGTYRPDQSHMSYSENGYYGAACPASHPTDISSIMYRIFYRPDEYGGSLTNLHLSSDVKMDQILPGGTTSHADWFGAWHPEAMDMWVDNCNNKQADCETGLLNRNPAVSMVPRKTDFHEFGYKAPATELVKLCPGKEYDPNDPLRSVAMCRSH